jgi:hypothetical protein
LRAGADNKTADLPLAGLVFFIERKLSLTIMVIRAVSASGLNMPLPSDS